jgi:hypothetical protein
MTDTVTNITLRDAMYAMSLAKRVPDAELLDDFVRRYPQHAEALTDFAIELAIDALQYGEEVDEDLPPETEPVSPAVARVMSRFQNRLFELRHAQAPVPQVRASTAVPAANPFAALDRNGFRALASRVHANTALLSKFRDRQIDFATIPQEYVRCVANEMAASLEDLSTHLCAATEVSTDRQFFKAEGKPKAVDRQTFEEAVRNSGLSEDQQRRLLSFGQD